MSEQKFVYVSYIRTTPDELWEALTNSEFTRQYWGGNSVESDWKEGTDIRFIHQDGRVTVAGVVLVAKRPDLLSYSWSFQKDAELAAEKPSRVTFLIERFEPNPELVKLTVTHDDFPVGSKAFADISNGWPMVLSSLKTLLETKTAIAFPGCR